MRLDSAFMSVMVTFCRFFFVVVSFQNFSNSIIVNNAATLCIFLKEEFLIQRFITFTEEVMFSLVSVV